MPIEIEAERAEMDIDPEYLIELLRMLHGAESKLSVVSDFKDRFNFISKDVIKKKIDEISS
jgi:hypothetical protein